MADSEYSTQYYKSPKINIGAIMKNLDTLKFIPDKLFLTATRINKCVIKLLIITLMH